MRDKLVCTYRGHSLDFVQERIHTICEYAEKEASLALLRTLCGHLSYASLFVIPDYELTTDKAYTVESSCFYVDGIIKLSYHRIIESFYELSAPDRLCSPEQALYAVLIDCAFGEVFSVLRLPMKECYIALLRCYTALTGNNVDVNPEESWYNIQLRFMEEVKYLAD